MTKYKITHKETKEEIIVGAEDKESALQIVCSNIRFASSLKNCCGWWDTKDVEIEELT